MSAIKSDNPTSIRPGEELDRNRLQTYLNAHADAVGLLTDIGQFPGGYSNLTYLLKTQTGKEYVLRRPPVGAKEIKGGHDMGREFRVLTLLKEAGYRKMPEPVLFCDDESVMDCPFYIMERVPGVILRAHSAPKMGISPDTMRQLSESLVDNLVALHALNLNPGHEGQPGLISLGKPEGYVRRQVDGWHNRYQASQTDDIPAMSELARWLHQTRPAENMPDNPKPTLLHNDFKYDNVVLNPDNLADVRAVLDWEMTTVGDPLMDVGTSLSYWAEASDGPFEKSFNLSWLPGNLTRQQFADRYTQQSGRDTSKILYYYVFGLFKNAVVIQQIYGRYKKGLTSDERFANLIAGVHVLATKAAMAVEKGNIT